MLLALYFVKENIITSITNLLNLTRLPAHLRSTTRECVHLVTRGHVIKMAVTHGSFTLPEYGFPPFWSCDLDLDPVAFIDEFDLYSVEI